MSNTVSNVSADGTEIEDAQMVSEDQQGPGAETAPEQDDILEEAQGEAVETPEKTPRSKSPVWLVLGGAGAAVIGFALSYALPGGWPVTPDMSALDTQGAALTQRIEQGQTQLVDIQAQVGTMAADLASLQDQMQGLSTRVQTIEQRPIVDAGAEARAALKEYEAAIAALQKTQQDLQGQVAKLQADLADRIAKAQELSDTAKAAAFQAQARAELNTLRAALDTGAPFTAQLNAVSTLPADVPQALSAVASAGLPSLPDLQSSFPEYARPALVASIKAQTPDGAGAWFMAFMRTQTGARSLEAREGDDPDAVLSRAEEALRNGQLAAVQQTLDGLPEEGQAIMAPWQQLAQARLDGLTAFDLLTTQLLNE
jgi:hypothetical protein